MRTDAHRPSAINPADYVFVACDYYGSGIDALAMIGEREYFRRHMEKTGGTFAQHHNNGTCHICGAAALYVAKFHHVPSNTYIKTGMDCAAKMEIGDEFAFSSFRKKIKAGIEAAAGRAKAQRILTDKGLADCWPVYTDGRDCQTAQGKYAASTIRDIVGKLVRYGSISDGQEKFLHGLLAKLATDATVTAERAAERASALPIPATDGRIKVTGTVISIREPDQSQAFPAWKMLVKHADGWTVWGSRVDCAERGDTVEFFARIQRSENDPKFGFFSRPTKGQVINRAAQEHAS